MTNILQNLADITTKAIATATGVAPIIQSGEQLAASLKRIVADLEGMPKNEDGSPTTLEQAAAHLQQSLKTGHALAGAMRQESADALAENAQETAGR